MASRPRENSGRPPSTIEAARRRAFWVAAGVVVVALALLITLRGNDEDAPPTEDVTSLPAPPPPPSTQGLVPDEVPPEAQAAAEEFADGYIRFSYGLAEASEIEGATPELVAKLERQNPRVPAAQEEIAKSVKVTSVTSSPITATTVEATATIKAGDTSYQLTLELRKDGQRWLVTDVSAGG